jgi:DNA-binding NtrC family response regulator
MIQGEKMPSLTTISSDQEQLVIASADNKFRDWIRESLQSSRWITKEAMGGADALATIEGQSCQVLLLDRWLPDLDAIELMAMVKTRHPKVDVILMDSQERSALLPPDLPHDPRADEIIRVLQAPWKTRQPISGCIQGEVLPVDVPKTPANSSTVELLPGMIGRSFQMTNACRLVRMVAPRTTTVLVTGETGTGKELVARAIHNLSPRARSPFAVVNCGAIPEALLEAELFGYERGSFTGATQSRVGRIQAASGGTLFLDEVGELPRGMQVKLLRFLQEGEVQRLGSTEVSRVDVRVIAATNSNLARQVADGLFRSDLYYRLSAFPVWLPPLRNRREDIVPLADHFLASLCRQAGISTGSFPAKVRQQFLEHSWPGNVRELQHTVERAFLLLVDEDFQGCAECPCALLHQAPSACRKDALSSCPFLHNSIPRDINLRKS